jgi:lipoprotein-anchoring transpeptidase ErfK/SrfK
MGKLRKILGMIATVAALSTTILVIAPATAQAASAPCGRKVRACIDLSANKAWLMDFNGRVTYGPVRITSGRPGYRTPPGVFKVIWKDRDHWSQEFDAPMPYSVFFTNTGIAFHEGSLAVQSHGCIHLGHRAAVRFFNKLRPGNVVAVQR